MRGPPCMDPVVLNHHLREYLWLFPSILSQQIQVSSCWPPPLVSHKKAIWKGHLETIVFFLSSFCWHGILGYLVARRNASGGKNEADASKNLDNRFARAQGGKRGLHNITGHCCWLTSAVQCPYARAGVLALLAGFAKYNCDLGWCMISGSGTVLLLRCSGCMALGLLLLFNLRDGSDLPPELDFVRVSFESRTSRLSMGMCA